MKTLSTVRNRYLTRVATVAGLIMGLAVNVSWAGVITGSAHDFSQGTYNFTGGQICVACHTPHGGSTSVTDAPLWNHTVTSTTNYTLYSSSTLTAGPLAQPSGVSKLCLSCHDGTVALDSYGTGNGTAGLMMSGSKAVASTAQGSLANDHPIGFVYDTTLATNDGALHNPAQRNVTIGTGGSRSKTGTVASMMLFSGRLECASCHDVHNTFTAENGATGTGGYPLLRVTKTGSALCLTCHDK